MNANHSIIIGHEEPIEMDICDLMRTMRLEASQGKELANDALIIPNPLDVHDILMSEDPSYLSDEGSDHSSLSSSSKLPYSNDEIYGCAYLQTIRRQLDHFPTTGGDYLEAIFTHREILSAYPPAHHQCARGFSDIAYMLEQRAWRADRDADAEAVSAFRHEAWSIAASMPPPPKQASNQALNSQPSYVCILPAM